MEDRLIRVLRWWYIDLKDKAQNGALLNTAGEKFRTEGER